MFPTGTGRASAGGCALPFPVSSRVTTGDGKEASDVTGVRNRTGGIASSPGGGEGEGSMK